ncbi:MAG: DUF3592 domain-containing protein [Anaerolineae bacterium]|nr:DUF3592 domain-containing protein [Anaerolineae bacterium]
MSETPDPTAILRSLHLLRSADPAERKQAIAVLRGLKADPRIHQVFEYLCQKDPDAGVRDLAQRILHEQAAPAPQPAQAAPEAVTLTETAAAPPPEPPTEPTPAPAAAAAPAVTETPAAAAPVPKTKRRKKKSAPSSRQTRRSQAKAARASAKKSARPRPPVQRQGNYFLLNPANAAFVAKEMHRLAETRRSKSGRSTFSVIAVLLVVVGVLWGLLLPRWLPWYQLRQDGVSVQATITDLLVRGGDSRYYAVYSFAPGGDDTPTYTDEQRITQTDFEGLHKQQTITVTFLPDSPDISYLEGYSDPGDLSRNWLSVIAVTLTALLLVLLVAGLLQRRQPRAAARATHLIKGEVVTCPGTLDDDGDYNVKLRYRFRSPSGRMMVNQSSRIRNDLKNAALPQPGTPVAIYYRNDQSYQVL